MFPECILIKVVDFVTGRATTGCDHMRSKTIYGDRMPADGPDVYMPADNSAKGFSGKIRFLLNNGKRTEDVPWGIVDVILLVGLIYILLHYDLFGMGRHVMFWLKKNYAVFTRDRRLFHFFTISVDTAILKAAAVVLVFISALVRGRRPMKFLFSRGNVPREWGTWVLPLYISICLVLRAFVLSSPLTASLPFNSVFVQSRFLGNIALVFSIICIAPFVEEMIFRGFMYPVMNKYTGVFPSIIIISVMFTAAHYPQIRFNWLFAVLLFCLSVLMTYARAVTGSTRIAVGMHAIYNSVALGVGIFDHMILTG
jgi:membrane protease YdiL (CAAX protease family)